MSEEKKDSFSVRSMIEDLDAGNFEAKLDYALRDVAAAVRNHESNKVKGELDLKFTIQRVGQGIEVMVDHKISTKKPTARGKKSEEDTTQTMMYVGQRGGLTIMPDNQIRLFEETGDSGAR